jgi:glucose/arabinose dehydrogenase
MTLENVFSSGERGLIDVALDPDFANNGHFYLYYTPLLPSRPVISRFTHQENGGGLTSTADPASELVLWLDTDGYISSIHFGGGLDFGPDGKLYLTTGDKSHPGLAQELDRSGGKILRMNSDGSIPPDNPFVDGSGGLEDAAWAYGLRNPFRARWDLPTGRFLIAEVGGNDNDLSWEDLHLATLADARTNFGWSLCEGPCDNPDFASTCDCDLHDDPIFAYPHAGSGASIIGGEVYRGNQFPSSPYFGSYFYGDFVRGWIRYLTFDASDTLVTGDIDFEPNAGPVIYIGQGPDGSLYYSTADGQVRRILYADGNQAPIISSAQASVTDGLAPLEVTFTASATDAEGDSLTYQWTFGDGNVASGPVVGGVIPPETNTYLTSGVYTAWLTVSDSSHTTLSSPIEIRVGTPPVVSITSPMNMSLFRAGDMINFSASAIDPDGFIDSTDYVWNIRFKHNEHLHPVLDNYIGKSGTFPIPTSGHDFSSNTGYVFDVTVTDVDGLSDADTTEIVPDKVTLSFDTVPTGLTIFLDDIPHVTPYIHDTLIGFEHTVDAPLTQCAGNTAQNFVAWSDSGLAIHSYTVPDFDDALTALYAGAGLCAEPTTDGLVLRLIADEKVTSNDTTVVFWLDLSPGGNDFLHVAGNPTIVENALKGHRVIRLNSRDDALGRFGLSGVPLGSSDRSMFMVVRYYSDGSGALLYGKDDCNQTFGLSVIEGRDNLTVEGRCPPNNFESATAGVGAGWLSHSAILRADTLTHYKDGDVINSATHLFQTGSDVILLNPETDDDPEVDMEVAEILIYNRALSEEERQEIELYFSNTYLGSLAPEISITEPAEGDTIFSDAASVVWASTGVLTQADHVHVSLDGTPPQSFPFLSGARTYTDLTPGSHYFVVELATAGHAVLARDSVNFITQPAQTSCHLVPTGLVLHLEADAGVDTTASQVTGWLDQSSSGNDFVSSGDPQLMLAGGPNGIPYIQFDGIDDKLERGAALTGFPTGADSRSVFFVVRYIDKAFGGFAFGNGADAEAFGLVTDGASLTLQGFGIGNDYPSPEPGIGEGWLIHSVILNGVFFQHFRDGSLIDQNAGSFNTVLSKAVVAEEISGLRFVELDAAAILVYDRALSETERAQVEAYLQNKYFGAPCTPVVDVPAPSLPQRFALHQNSPNPFRGTSVIRFDLPMATKIELVIFDVRGREVRRAIDGVTMPAGSHNWLWNGRDEAGTAVSSGIYFYRLKTPQFTESRKAIVHN